MPTNSAGAAKGTADMGAVFDQLSKGEAVTAGLRKVDQSQQTHKNPSLRTSSAVPVRSDSQQSTSSRGKSPVPGKRPKPESMRTKKPPRKELDGNKWIIENYEGGPDGVAEVEIDAAISHSILVTRCSNTIIRVLNKANAISVDSSARVSLIIDSLVSSVDVIKTARFEMQVLGTLPTVLLDQVDGATVYLSRHSLATEVFTSKCTAVNVNVPGRDDDEDYSECPLPEQIKTVIRDGVAFSEIVEHAG
jgi:adenylyl cyclase-associated protein